MRSLALKIRDWGSALPIRHLIESLPRLWFAGNQHLSG
jgi:hypothetical protein